MGLGCHEIYFMICNVYFSKLLNKEHQLGVKHQTLQEAKKTLNIVTFNTLEQFLYNFGKKVQRPWISPNVEMKMFEHQICCIHLVT